MEDSEKLASLFPSVFAYCLRGMKTPCSHHSGQVSSRDFQPRGREELMFCAAGGGEAGADLAHVRALLGEEFSFNQGVQIERRRECLYVSVS